MSSKRDLLKKLNQAQAPVEEKEVTTVIDQLANEYEKQESTTKDEPLDFEGVINVMDKSKVGRPKLYEGEQKLISAKLKMENYEHARKVGGKYGGMTGYINWLIEQDMKR